MATFPGMDQSYWQRKLQEASRRRVKGMVDTVDPMELDRVRKRALP
jgi:hypothetical protein